MSIKIPTKLTGAYEKAISYLFHLMPMSEMDIESIIAEDAMIYGTTVDENIFGIDDFKRIMKMQANELEGLEPQFERTPVFQHVSDDGKTALFIEEVKLTVNSREKRALPSPLFYPEKNRLTPGIT